MSSKAISTLALLITANATQLAGEFNRVDNIVSRSTMKWQRGLSGGLKMGIGISGAQAALGIVNNEIRHVIANIENIPGIPATAVASIVEARGEFQAFRNTVDIGLAKLLEWGRVAAQSVGAGLAMITGGANGEDVSKALSRVPTPDEIARSRDPGFDDKLRNAATRFSENQTLDERKKLTPAAQYRSLVAESERLKTFAGSGNQNALQKAEAMIKAQQRISDANDIYRKAQDASNQALQRWTDSQIASATASMSPAEAMAKLKDQISTLQHEVETVNAQMMASGGADIETLERRTQLYEQLRIKQEQLNPLLEEQRRKWEELGGTIASSFENAVLQGEGLSGILKSLEQQLLKMAFNAMITKPLEGLLGKLFGGGSSSGGVLGTIFGGIGTILGFAEGGEPPVGRASIVGELGPELFVPKVPGTVISNSSLKSIGRGGHSGNTYVIDARGADSGVVERLRRALIELAGPGVVEKRAVYGVRDAMSRGKF